MLNRLNITSLFFLHLLADGHIPASDTGARGMMSFFHVKWIDLWEYVSSDGSEILD